MDLTSIRLMLAVGGAGPLQLVKSPVLQVQDYTNDNKTCGYVALDIIMTIPQYHENIHGRTDDLALALLNKIISSIMEPNALYVRNMRFFLIGCRTRLSKAHNDGYPDGNSFIACRFVERANYDGSCYWTLDTCPEEEDKK